MSHKRFVKMSHQAMSLPMQDPLGARGFNQIDAFASTLQDSFPADYDIYKEVITSGEFNATEMGYLNDAPEAGLNSSVRKISRKCRLKQIEHIRGHFKDNNFSVSNRELDKWAKLIREENLGTDLADLTPVGPKAEHLAQLPGNLYNIVANQNDYMFNVYQKAFLAETCDEWNHDGDSNAVEAIEDEFIEEDKEIAHTNEKDCMCYNCRAAAELIADEENAKKKKQKKKKKKAKNKKDQEDDASETVAHNDSTTQAVVANKVVDPYSDENDDVDIGKLSNKIEMINTDEIVSAQLFKEINKTKSEAVPVVSTSNPQQTEAESMPKLKNKVKQAENQQPKQENPSRFVHQEPKYEIEDHRSKTIANEWQEKGESFKQHQQESMNEEWIQVKNKKEEQQSQRRPSTPVDLELSYEVDLNIIPAPSKNSVVNGVPILETNINVYKAKLLLMEAQLSEARGMYEDAIMQATLAIKCDSKNPVGYINRSYYYEMLENFEESLADANTAIELDKLNEFSYYAYYRYFKAHMALGNWSEAEEAIQHLIVFDHKLVESRPNVALDHQHFFKKEAMILRLKALIDMDCPLTLARLYAQRYNRFEKAYETMKANIQYLEEHAKKNVYEERLHKQLIKRLKANQREDKRMKMIAVEDDEEEDEEDDSDDELFFSDDEEHNMFYADADYFVYPKILLTKLSRPRPRVKLMKEKPDLKDGKDKRGLYIRNILPDCSASYLTQLFMKFGNVIFLRMYPKDDQSVSSMLVTFDNGISAKVARAYLQGRIIDGVNRDVNGHTMPPLIVRFYNRGQASTTANEDENGASGSAVAGVNSPNKNLQAYGSECYYWRTTGCEIKRCGYQHVLENKGVDLESWMANRNRQKGGKSNAACPLTFEEESSPARTNSSSSSREECCFWRAAGCDKGDKCLFEHLPKSRGIDLQNSGLYNKKSKPLNRKRM